MIKQPFLPLKFYNELDEQQYRKLMDNMGAEWTRLIGDTEKFPPFQIKRETRPNLVSQFDLVNYDDGTVTAKSVDNLDIKSASIEGTTYDWIVYDGFPFTAELSTGAYYIIISDDIETWYSEVFEVCDLYQNPLTTFTNNGFNGMTSAVAAKYINLRVCESTANGAEAYSNTFEIIYNEPFDLMVDPRIGTLGCGTAVWGDGCKFELREDVTGTVVSNTAQTTGEDVFLCTQLLPTKTCTARLYVYLDNTEVAWQNNIIWLWPKKLNNYTLIEWYDDINFCDIIYTDTIGDDDCQYINKLFISRANDILPSYETEEDATETDEKEQAFMMQVAKKFHTIKLSGGHHLSDALSIVRMHENINIYLDTGEVLDVCEFTMENSAVTDYCELMTLTFREEGCAKSGCDDYTLTECCCPNLENVIDDTTVPGLPAQPCCNGDRYIALFAPSIYYIYESDGAAWNRQTDEEVANACVYHETNAVHWFWNGTTFTPLLQFVSVIDNADGTATLTLNCPTPLVSWTCTFYVVAIVDGVVTGQPVDNVEANTNGVTVTTGAGNFDFQLKLFTHNCEIEESGVINQTITA